MAGLVPAIHAFDSRFKAMRATSARDRHRRNRDRGIHEAAWPDDIALGRRGITADTAFRLARYFGTTPDFWINLQARYDVDAAERKLRRRIEREVRPRAA